MARLYLDYNATAPLRPEAHAAMLDALAAVGNASSVHGEGRDAHRRIESARADVARLVGADAKLVTFTSGGTEANGTALTPNWTFRGRPHPADVLLVGATEHVSALSGGRFAPGRVRQIAVDGNGIVQPAALTGLLAEATAKGERAIVSIMLANNETGVIQSVADLARIAHEAGAIVHSDAIQAAGRITIDIAALGVDVLTLSAHKIGGPQGAGAIIRAGEDLFVRTVPDRWRPGEAPPRRYRERRSDRRVRCGGAGCARRSRQGAGLVGMARRARLYHDGIRVAGDRASAPERRGCRRRCASPSTGFPRKRW